MKMNTEYIDQSNGRKWGRERERESEREREIHLFFLNDLLKKIVFILSCINGDPKVMFTHRQKGL